jgi:hypothetical protein
VRVSRCGAGRSERELNRMRVVVLPQIQAVLCVGLLAKMSWTRNTPSQPMPIKVTTSGQGKHSD